MHLGHLVLIITISLHTLWIIYILLLILAFFQNMKLIRKIPPAVDQLFRMNCEHKHCEKFSLYFYNKPRPLTDSTRADNRQDLHLNCFGWDLTTFKVKASSFISRTEILGACRKGRPWHSSFFRVPLFVHVPLSRELSLTYQTVP